MAEKYPEKSENSAKSESSGNPRKTQFERPSERMFRRSRAAEQRRLKSSKGDMRLIILIFNVVVFTALLLTLIMFMTQSSFINAAG